MAEPVHLNLPPIQVTLKSICVTVCGPSSPIPMPKVIHVDILDETAIVECFVSKRQHEQGMDESEKSWPAQPQV